MITDRLLYIGGFFMKYITTGVCSKEISFEVIDNKIRDVEFVKGCAGNLIGLSSLVDGMDVDEVISRLQGIKCGNKNTSCPDQLSKALLQYKNS